MSGRCWWTVIIVKLGELSLSDTKLWQTNLFYPIIPQLQHDFTMAVDADIVAGRHINQFIGRTGSTQ